MNSSIKVTLMFSILICILITPFSIAEHINNTESINKLTVDQTSQIEDLIKREIEKGKIPGLSIVIVEEGEVIYKKGFGYANLETREKIDNTTLFELGSTSKAFTALGILKLQDEGFLNVDDEVNQYIPWLEVKYNDKVAPVTIAQLLHHTSGIKFSSIDKIPVSVENNALEETVKTLIGHELDSEPGDKFQYATINYDVLGLIIERVSGISYEEYTEKNILKPLGLNNSYAFKNAEIGSRMAKGYKIAFGRAREYKAKEYRGNKPAGYIISNIDDMARWLKIQTGTALDTNFNLNLIEESHFPNRSIPSFDESGYYACGWFVNPKDDIISHGGNNPNFSSYIILQPLKKTGVVVLSNINSGYTGDVAKGVSSILSDNHDNSGSIDLNVIVDKVASALILISSVITLWIFYKIFRVLRMSKLNSLSIKYNEKRSLLKLFFLTIFMLGLSYCIYVLPYVLYRGVSWSFIFEWLPFSIKIALLTLYISIISVYIYSVLIIKKVDKEHYYEN